MAIVGRLTFAGQIIETGTTSYRLARLTFAGQIIETGTTSYRLARARQRRADGRDRK